MNREGGVESCEVKGTLTFTANSDVGTTAVVAVNKPPKFTFATHPKNCWPEDKGSGSINVDITFDLLRTDMTLTDFNIRVPLVSTDPPSIISIDRQYKCDKGMMWWHHDIIDNGNATGSIEFSTLGQYIAAFFPVEISFRSFEIKKLLKSLS